MMTSMHSNDIADSFFKSGLTFVDMMASQTIYIYSVQDTFATTYLNGEIFIVTKIKDGRITTK
jgi:hypothetical protein